MNLVRIAQRHALDASPCTPFVRSVDPRPHGHGAKHHKTNDETDCHSEQRNTGNPEGL